MLDGWLKMAENGWKRLKTAENKGVLKLSESVKWRQSLEQIESEPVMNVGYQRHLQFFRLTHPSNTPLRCNILLLLYNI